MSLWPLCRVWNTTALLYACHRYTEAGQEDEEEDVELICNFSSLANCVNLHLLISDLSNMELIHVSHPHVILFLLLVCFIYFEMCS